MLAAHGAFHLGDFLGALVDQEDDDVAFGMIDENTVSHLL